MEIFHETDKYATLSPLPKSGKAKAIVIDKCAANLQIKL